MIPSMYTALSEDAEEQFEKMLEVLEDDEDVQDIYHNAEESRLSTPLRLDLGSY